MSVDLGVHEPRASVGPTRGPTGVREDGRLLSTVEQMDEAVRWMLAEAAKRDSPDVVRAEIRWSRREPTSLVVTLDYERTPAGPTVATVRTMVELDEFDGMIERSATALVREAKAEARSLLQRGY